MVPCRSCKIYHDVRQNCKVASNQLRAGTLAEPWLGANRNGKEKQVEVVKKSLMAEREAVRVVQVGLRQKVGRPRKYDDPEARRKEYIRLYMKDYRAKGRLQNL